MVLKVLHSSEDNALVVEYHLEDQSYCFIGSELSQGMRYDFVDGGLGSVLLNQFKESVSLPLHDEYIVSQLGHLQIITECGLLGDLLELRERVDHSFWDRYIIVIELDIASDH